MHARSVVNTFQTSSTVIYCTPKLAGGLSTRQKARDHAEPDVDVGGLLCVAYTLPLAAELTGQCGRLARFRRRPPTFCAHWASISVCPTTFLSPN